MLKITVTCCCGSHYELNDSCNNIGYIMCPNCRSEIDSNNDRVISQFISASKAFAKSDIVSSLSVDFRSE